MAQTVRLTTLCWHLQLRYLYLVLHAGRYLLKVWILKHKRDEMYRAMWEVAMDEMIAKLVLTAEKAGLTYVAEMHGFAFAALPFLLRVAFNPTETMDLTLHMSLVP